MEDHTKKDFSMDNLQQIFEKTQDKISDFMSKDTKTPSLDNSHLKHALVAAGLYIFIQLFWKANSVHVIGIMISTVLASFVWFYLSKYFFSENDKVTGILVLGIMVILICSSVINIIGVSVDWGINYGEIIWDLIFSNKDSRIQRNATLFKFLNKLNILLILLAVVIGIKVVLTGKKRSNTLLFWIGLSTIILIPNYIRLTFDMAIDRVVIPYMWIFINLVPYVILSKFFLDEKEKMQQI